MSSRTLRPTKPTPTIERECLFCDTPFECPQLADDSWCEDCSHHTGICLTCDRYTVLRDKQCIDCLAESDVHLEPDEHERIQTIVIHPDGVQVVLPNPRVSPPTPPKKRTFEGMTGCPEPIRLRVPKPPCPGLVRVGDIIDKDGSINIRGTAQRALELAARYAIDLTPEEAVKLARAAAVPQGCEDCGKLFCRIPIKQGKHIALYTERNFIDLTI